MSITFTPTAGTWTTYSYYPVEEGDCVVLGKCANGLHCTENEEPSINMANGNAYHFFEVIGHPLPDCCGELTVEQLIAIRKVCNDMLLLDFDNPSEQLDRYACAFRNIADHCIYHNCSVSYG